MHQKIQTCSKCAYIRFENSCNEIYCLIQSELNELCKRRNNVLSFNVSAAKVVGYALAMNKMM